MVKREKRSVNRKRLVKQGPWRIGELLHEGAAVLAAAGIPAAQREAQALLGHVGRLSRTQLLTSLDLHMNPARVRAFDQLLDQRAQRKPLQYLLGEEGFWGEVFQVGEGVLIPRPETELLIEAAVRLGRRHAYQRIVDLGTGSGILALTLARLYPSAEVLGVDISPLALGWARKNRRRQSVANCRFRLSDADQALPKALRGKVSLVVSNPPYIPRHEIKDLQPEVRCEPVLALEGGIQGTEKIEHMLAAAGRLLEKQGVFICEIGIHQADAVRSLFVQYGFSEVEGILDWQKIPRIFSGVKTAET